MVPQHDHPVRASSCNQCLLDLSANNRRFFSYLSEIAIEDEDPIPVSSDLDWDPTILDHLDDDKHWYDAFCDMDEPPYDSLFDLEDHICHCGAPTKLISTDDTRKLIYHPNIWSADDSETCNLCLDPLNNDVALSVICSHHDSSLHGEGEVPSNMPIINPHDLVGHTFLFPQQEDGQCF
jgi:hypothetical protein